MTSLFYITSIKVYGEISSSEFIVLIDNTLNDVLRMRMRFVFIRLLFLPSPTICKSKVRDEGTLRSNLVNHFGLCVAYDDNGNPWKEDTEIEKERFSKLSKQKQVHSQYQSQHQ